MNSLNEGRVEKDLLEIRQIFGQVYSTLPPSKLAISSSLGIHLFQNVNAPELLAITCIIML